MHKIRALMKKHDIIWFDSLDSTNNEVKRRISDIDNLSVVAAVEQSAGRGQGDHIWLSERGKNLLFSMVLKLEEGQMEVKDAFGISGAVSGALVRFLADHGIEAWVKLPNDIYVRDRKICGTLIENTIRNKWLITSIIGIGLNVNQTEFDASLPNPTSMALETKKAYDVDVCLDELLNALILALQL